MTATLDLRAQQLLAEAAEWRLLGLLLECPGEEWRRRLDASAGSVADPALRAAARQAMEEAAEGVYHSIFGPGGPAPPREVAYSESLQPGLLLAELEAYYEAFAYRPDTREAADHVAVEAGFIAFLRLKEAYALASGNHEQASVAREAAGRFLHEHLSRIAGPLNAALGGSGIAYLKTAARALLDRASPPPAP